MILKGKKIYIYLIIISTLIVACGSEKKHVSKEELDKIKKTIPAIHRNMVKNIADSIHNYVKNNNLSMVQTPTGMWYRITVDKSGDLIKNGDIVYLDYRLMNLYDSVIYCSDSTGQLNFTVGSGGVEKGLEEMILLLNEGDKAQMILPPHLGHGLTGDMKKIPRLSILKYDIFVSKVVKVEK